MMNTILTRKASSNEINWVNSKYTEVSFVKSNFENEFIVIAEVNNQKAGLGRLVIIDDRNIELGGIYVFKEYRKMGVADSIVSFLCTNNPFKDRVVWCLPFENLKEFYSNFGFNESANIKIPNQVASKYKWCNTTYDKKVLSLSKID